MPSSAWLGEVRRTSIARITLIYTLLFAGGVAALIALVQWQAGHSMTRRIDTVLNARYARLAADRPEVVPQRIQHALAIDGGGVNVYALFDGDGRYLTGNLRVLPERLTVGGEPVVLRPTALFPSGARIIARRLPSGQTLILGRELSQLVQTEHILLRSVLWAALMLVPAALALGVAFSLGPLRRVRALQEACRDISQGNLARRLPSRPRGDELDTLAGTVNQMVAEVERLMVEVRGVADTVAHDLRTPLTAARSRLHRLAERLEVQPELAEEAQAVIDEVDAALERFRALMRISELEARRRRAGFASVDPVHVIREAAELHMPVAEAKHVALELDQAFSEPIEADGQLLFEAVSNLLDNAVKFTPPGGRIAVSVRPGPTIVVSDSGPGIPDVEAAAVLQPFYRIERDRLVPGSGLGLSIVRAICRLHGFNLRLQSSEAGLRAMIECSRVEA